MTSLTVVVTGASGQIGRFLLPRLAGRGHTVIAVSRQGQPPLYPSFQGVAWRPPDQLQDSASALISCGPLAVAAERVRMAPALQRVVAFSSTSLVTKQDSTDPQEQQVVSSLGNAEQSLSRACAEAGMDLTLLRPTLVYGCGLDANITLLARLIERFGFLPIAGDASGLRQPVHAEDLALAAVNAMESGAAAGRILDLPGGATISYRQMVTRVSQALGQPARMVRLPAPLLRAAVRALRLWPGLSALSPELVDRQNQDLVFDGTEARQLLDFSPRGFDPANTDFQPPEPSRLRQTFLGTPAS